MNDEDDRGKIARVEGQIRRTLIIIAIDEVTTKEEADKDERQNRFEFGAFSAILIIENEVSIAKQIGRRDDKVSCQINPLTAEIGFCPKKFLMQLFDSR